MNYQKLSKTALIKLCKNTDKYLDSLHYLFQFGVEHSNADNDDAFLQLQNVKTQRQLGIVQILRVMNNYSQILWHHRWKRIETGELPTMYEERERMLNKIKQFMKD